MLMRGAARASEEPYKSIKTVVFQRLFLG